MQRQNLTIDLQHTYPFSPFVFGHNLEHTRGSVTGGLSAQMLRNRKFVGAVTRNEGCPLEWFGIGSEHAFFDQYSSFAGADKSIIYTCHYPGVHKGYDSRSLIIQNLRDGELCGIGQSEIALTANRRYIFKAITKCEIPVTVTVSLTDRDGVEVYDTLSAELIPGDWQTVEGGLTAPKTDPRACLRITYTAYAKVILGVVSLLPEDSFFGMRKDVIESLKELGVTMLRWPGGNFAGDYVWKDGLLPVDQRAPLKAYIPSTLPYGRGYDDHEIGIDEFMALCRELGAEPSITINPVWCTPEDNAAWVEYCNGSADTEYGALRVQRGYTQPYNVIYWGLGNELGHGHMEGPNTPESYAKLIRKHAEAMLRVCPDLELCSTGPYPSEDWAKNSATPLSDIVKNVSVHWYFNIYHEQWDYSTPEKSQKTATWIMNGIDTFRNYIHAVRRDVPGDVKIAFDEWNVWRAWFRPLSTAEGILAGRLLHMFMEESVRSNMPVCDYFEPVAEGAIVVGTDSCQLTAMGQMFTLLKAHLGGRICPLVGVETVDAMATLQDDVVTVTLLNTDVEATQAYTLALQGEVAEAKALVADGILPHSRFREEPAEIRMDDSQITTIIPPCSAVRLRVRINQA